MDKKQAIMLAKQYKEYISGWFDGPKVYLYGSYSKNCARKDSDIDVAVVVPKLSGDFLMTLTQLWTASRKVSTLIEPVLIEECNTSPLYEDILQTGIAV